MLFSYVIVVMGKKKKKSVLHFLDMVKTTVHLSSKQGDLLMTVLLDVFLGQMGTLNPEDLAKLRKPTLDRFPTYKPTQTTTTKIYFLLINFAVKNEK